MMIKVLCIFLGLVGLGFCGAWLADHPGLISMQWGGWRIETSTGVATSGLIVLLILVAAIYRFWRWLLNSPQAIKTFRAEGRRKKGYKSLSSGLVAVAAGDLIQAKKLAVRTSRLLDDTSLTLLLSAQAAQLDGDESSARRYFQAMRERPETEFLGLRGLLVQARRDNNQAEALALARRAFALRPDAPWVGNELFSLEAATGDWQAAEKTLSYIIKKKLLLGRDAKRHQAIVLFAQALAASDSGESNRALEFARKAHAQLPDFIPAIKMVAQLYSAGGEMRKAQRLLRDGWQKAPHPELLTAWLDLRNIEDAGDRMGFISELVADNLSATESRVALARAALEAEEFEQARQQLKILVNQSPDARVARLFADLEEADKGDGTASRKWLRQAAILPADATWICENCSKQIKKWLPHCPDCGHFDQFSWRQPLASGSVMPYLPDPQVIEVSLPKNMVPTSN